VNEDRGTVVGLAMLLVAFVVGLMAGMALPC